MSVAASKQLWGGWTPFHFKHVSMSVRALSLLPRHKVFFKRPPDCSLVAPAVLPSTWRHAVCIGRLTVQHQANGRVIDREWQHTGRGGTRGSKRKEKNTLGMALVALRGVTYNGRAVASGGESGRPCPCWEDVSCRSGSRRLHISGHRLMGEGLDEGQSMRGGHAATTASAMCPMKEGAGAPTPEYSGPDSHAHTPSQPTQSPRPGSAACRTLIPAAMTMRLTQVVCRACGRRPRGRPSRPVPARAPAGPVRPNPGRVPAGSHAGRRSAGRRASSRAPGGKRGRCASSSKYSSGREATLGPAHGRERDRSDGGGVVLAAAPSRALPRAELISRTGPPASRPDAGELAACFGRAWSLRRSGRCTRDMSRNTTRRGCSDPDQAWHQEFEAPSRCPSACAPSRFP